MTRNFLSNLLFYRQPELVETISTSICVNENIESVSLLLQCEQLEIPSTHDFCYFFLTSRRPCDHPSKLRAVDAKASPGDKLHELIRSKSLAFDQLFMFLHIGFTRANQRDEYNLHCSVRDFLIGPENRWVCEPDKAVLGFRIDVTQTLHSSAWLCLNYMKLKTETGQNLQLDICNSTQALWDSSALLDYATS